MSKQFMGQKENHGAPFLVASYGKVQVSFFCKKKRCSFENKWPKVFHSKMYISNMCKTKIAPTSINCAETKLSQPFVKTTHVLA